MWHLLSAMSVRLWIVMYIETEIGAELGSAFTEEHALLAAEGHQATIAAATVTMAAASRGGTANQK